jgi:hypothetical protein
MAKKTFATSELEQLLLLRYPKDAYAVLWEVGDATGSNCRRHADALVMSLWPSRGLDLMGFEIKASRTDWLKERDNPAKAESIMKYCDRWSIIIADENMIQKGELPETWGLMAPSRGALRCIKEAPELHPNPISKNFLAAIMRKIAQQSADVRLLENEKKEAYARGWNSGKWELENVQKELANKNESIRLFEQESGVKIDGWDGATRIGEAVKIVLAGEHMVNETQLKRIRSIAENIIISIKEIVGD